MSVYNVENMKDFVFWCNKVIPLVYSDSLSYYEVLCKAVDYINKMLADTQALVKITEALQASVDRIDPDAILQQLDELQKAVDQVTESAGKVPGLESSVNDLKQSVSTLEQNVTTQGENVSALQQSVSGIQNNVTTLQQNMSSVQSALTEVQNWQSTHGDQWVIDLIKANTEPGILGGSVLDSGSNSMTELVNAGKSGDYYVENSVTNETFAGLPKYGSDYDGYNLMLIASGAGEKGSYYATYTAYKQGMKGELGTGDPAVVSKKYWFTSGSIKDGTDPVWIGVDTAEELPDFMKMVQGIYGNVVDLGYKTVTALGDDCEYGIFFVPGTVTEDDFKLMPEYGSANGYVVVVNSTGSKVTDRHNDAYWVYRISTGEEVTSYVDKIWVAYAPQSAQGWLQMYPLEPAKITFSDTTDPMIKLGSDGVYVNDPVWGVETSSSETTHTPYADHVYIDRTTIDQQGKADSKRILHLVEPFGSGTPVVYAERTSYRKASDGSVYNVNEPFFIMPRYLICPDSTDHMDDRVALYSVGLDSDKKQFRWTQQKYDRTLSSTYWVVQKRITGLTVTLSDGVELAEGINFIRYSVQWAVGEFNRTSSSPENVTNTKVPALLFKKGDRMWIHSAPNSNPSEYYSNFALGLDIDNMGETRNLYTFNGSALSMSNMNLCRIEGINYLEITSAE